MSRRLLLPCLVLLGHACTTRPHEPATVVAAAPKIIVVNPKGADSTIALDSVGQIRGLLFRELAAHRNDSAYKHFMMLGDTAGGWTYQAEIVLGRLFHHSQRSAVLAWSVNDSVQDMEVLQLHEDGQYVHRLYALHQPGIRSGMSSIRDEFLYFQDFNADGWRDLQLVTEAWDGIGFGFHSRLWLVGQHGFRPVHHFEEIATPELDSVTGRIYSYYSGGCSDMSMFFSEWRLAGPAVTMTRAVGVDCCVGSNGNCLVRIDERDPIPVPGDKVHLYVPEFYRQRLQEKMGL